MKILYKINYTRIKITKKNVIKLYKENVQKGNVQSKYFMSMDVSWVSYS